MRVEVWVVAERKLVVSWFGRDKNRGEIVAAEFARRFRNRSHRNRPIRQSTKTPTMGPIISVISADREEVRCVLIIN